MVTLQKFVGLSTMGALSPGGRRRLRGLHVSGVLLALSGIGSVLLVAQLGAPDVADIVALRIFAYSCWLYGGLGLWTLLAPEALGNVGLARLRGMGEQRLLSEMGLLFRRLSSGILFAGLPAIALAAWISPVFPDLGSGVTLLLACATYALTLCSCLALIGALFRRVSPARARILTALFLLVPFASSSGTSGVPDLVGAYVRAFGWLLDQGMPS